MKSRRIFSHLLLILISGMTVFPFLWMTMGALKTSAQVMDVSRFFPENPQFQNFLYIFTDSPIPVYLMNSLLVSVCAVFMQVALCSLFAYGVTFFRFPGCRLLYRLVLVTYMVPTAATYIPCYIILSKMNMLDSYSGLILSNGISVFGIFLLRQAFCQMPMETIEAARMDGAGHLNILIRVVVPMTRTSFFTFILLSCINTYNSYMWPSLITNRPELSLISQGLRRFLYDGGAYGTEWALVMAASTVAVFPLLLLFVFTWPWILNGITDLGSKG